MTAASGAGERTARFVILAGIAAALHVGKLPPALPVLRGALGLTLVEAGFMLSLVQLAGMTLGLIVGLAADTFGLRRGMVLGLIVLGTASVVGASARTPAALLALRALEGVGFLLTVTPAPGLIRRLVGARPERSLGLWGAYMPLGTALALLAAPVVIGASGWPAWWRLLGGLTLVMAVVLRIVVPADPAPSARSTAIAPLFAGLRTLAGRTLGAPGPWAAALGFAVYSGQWIAVLGFLPSIYAQAGVAAGLAGLLTALVAVVNMLGNIAAGRLLHRGTAPERLLRIGYATMAAGAAIAYLPGTGSGPLLRLIALLLFSMVGGLVPGTLFAVGVRLAPGAAAVSSTVGWMQQCSAFGQFAAPPLVAWVAHRVGGWQWTWVVTGTMSAAGGLLSVWLARLLKPDR